MPLTATSPQVLSQILLGMNNLLGPLHEHEWNFLVMADYCKAELYMLGILQKKAFNLKDFDAMKFTTQHDLH